jgi:sugar lactone lactonase YvrE
MRKVVAYFLAAIVTSWVFVPTVSRRLTVEAQDAAPSIRRLRPDIITAGTRTFTMRLDGKNFADGSNILFDGVALASPRTSGKRRVLLAEVDASLIASPGTHTVQAVNPDGTTSTTETFTVQAQDPALMIRLDGNAAQEDSGFTFLPTLLTDSFTAKSEVLVWGKAVTATATGGGVDIEIPSDLVNDPAEIPITLRDRDGNISNTELFFVVPQPAEITGTDPDSLEVGTDDVPLNVSGFFKPGAVIVVNDMPLPTTVGKNDRLETILPGALRSQTTQLVVRVEQDGIQSQDWIIPVTPTGAPFIFSIAPAVVRQGEHKPSVLLIGGNFKGDITALLDGQPANVRNSTHQLLTVAIPDDLAVGTHTIQVMDSSGTTTSSFSFSVVPDVTVTTLVGTGKTGFDLGCVSGDQATFLRPRRLAFGPDGLLYITDQQNHAIRTVNVTTRQTCTLAGTGEDGYNDSGNALGKPPTFSFPNGVAVAANGTVYVTENGNCVVRRIQKSGSDITVDTFAGSFSEVTSTDRQKRFNSTRQGLASYRNAGLLDSAFRLPDDIIIAPNGTIYIADAGNHSIRRIRQAGGQSVVDTVAGNGVPGFADGMAANARFNTPTALALSADGNFLFVADTNNNRVRRIDLVNGRVSTFAGGGAGPSEDGPGGEAALFSPIGLALDSNGVLFVSEFAASDIRRIDPARNVTTVAGGGGSKQRDGSGIFARFNAPRGLAIDAQRGILYVADYEDLVIRAIALR